MPLFLLALSACPVSEKVGENHDETSDSHGSSGTTTGDASSSGTATSEPTTTESVDSTATTSDPSTGSTTGSTTVMGGGPPSECGPPCEETWTYFGELVINAETPTDELKCMTRVVGTLDVFDVDQNHLSGLRNLVSVEGNLVILSDTITDLSPFSCLEEVTSQIQLGNAKNLVDVSGFSALRHTERFLMWYTAATQVPTFSPEFSGLAQVEISGNDALVDLAGMKNWKAHEAGAWAIITDNLSLKSVADVKPLLSGNPTQSSVTLANLPALASLAGLEGFTELNWIDLKSLPLIQDLAPLGQLKTVGWLGLSGMPLVEDLQPLSQLETAQRLSIGNCVPADLHTGMDGLTSLAGLSSLTTLEELSVYDNKNLTTLAGADKLTSITKSWAEVDNPALDPAAVIAFEDQVSLEACSTGDRACVCFDPPPGDSETE